VWPHGFDIACEWYSTRMVEHDENGTVTTSPAQINLGLYPKDGAYFYSNPWPFDAAALLDVPLPEPAAWHTDGWLGSILAYDEVAGRPDGRRRVLEFAAAVHAAAAPTLGD
jgi:Family of unknown function (DUF5996)